MNILQQNTAYLHSFDPEVASIVEREYDRQNQNIELIASENIASPAVIAAMGSVLTNWPSSAPRRFSARSLPTSSRIPAHRPIWRSTPPCSSRAIRSWAWILPTAAT